MINTLEDEIRRVLNLYSQENQSDSPDFILATYLTSCLNAFNFAVRRRDEWHDFKPFGRETGLLGKL